MDVRVGPQRRLAGFGGPRTGDGASRDRFAAGEARCDSGKAGKTGKGGEMKLMAMHGRNMRMQTYTGLVRPNAPHAIVPCDGRTVGAWMQGTRDG